MATSFINERTAEYVLVPKFNELLLQSHKKVIPIFFWSTREGGISSKKCLQDTKIKIVALYARRPKIEQINQAFIEVKFNESLFLQSAKLQTEGIPVFAGVPVVTNLSDLNLGSPCAWFKINLGIECIVKLFIENGNILNCDSVKKVETSDILNLISLNAKSMDWRQAIEILKNARRQQYQESQPLPFWGQIYRPVFFLLSE